MGILKPTHLSDDGVILSEPFKCHFNDEADLVEMAALRIRLFLAGNAEGIDDIPEYLDALAGRLRYIVEDL